MRASLIITVASLTFAAPMSLHASGSAALNGSLAFELSDGYAIRVPVTVNGDQVTFLLDTGSNRSAVSSRLAVRLGLPIVARTTSVSSMSTTANDVTRPRATAFCRCAPLRR